MNSAGRRLLVFVEGISCAMGVVGLSAWALLHAGSAVTAQQDLERFAVLQAAELHESPPDQSLWSAVRVNAFRKAIAEPAGAPLAVLRIPKIRLEAAVLPGTADRTLDRALGHIENTAPPGTTGNIGIAGHRDGFFRGLKDVVPGDAVELDTLHGKEFYRVERTWVVDPEDVSVLRPTAAGTMTLVTCYPFYFVGPAPRRFIVRAVRIDDGPGSP
jgi:sortase A